MGCMRVDIPATEPSPRERVNEALRKWMNESLNRRLWEMFGGWLSNGYVDFSKLPEWIWMFEVKGGMLDRCLGTTEFIKKDGSRTVYCREAFVRLVVDNNQHIGISLINAKINERMDAESESHDGCEYDFYLQAVLPRFMGILHYRGDYVLVYFMDGRIFKAWSVSFISTDVIKKLVKVINDSTPFFVSRHKSYDVNNIVFSAVPKVNVDELDRDVRRELVRQLNDVGVEKLSLWTRNI